MVTLHGHGNTSRSSSLSFGGSPVAARQPLTGPASLSPVVGTTNPLGGSSDAGWAPGAQVSGGSMRPEQAIQTAVARASQEPLWSKESASSMLWRLQAAGAISRSSSGGA